MFKHSINIALKSMKWMSFKPYTDLMFTSGIKMYKPNVNIMLTPIKKVKTENGHVEIRRKLVETCMDMILNLRIHVYVQKLHDFD